MSSGLESLHKILKDEKRRTIITLLQEKDGTSYTELMTALGIKSTGKLNYHLKVLCKLITKNPDGLYVLTDKGKLAVNLLKEFSERKSQAQVEAAPYPKGYYIIVSLFSSVFISLNAVLFFLGQITTATFLEHLVTTILAFIFLVAAERARAKRLLWQPSRQMLGAAFSIVFAFAFVGGVCLFFVGGFVLFGLVPQWIHSFFPTFNSWIVTSFVLGSVFGGLVGYFVFRRSRYSDPEYYKPF
jgi:hypothetical protein